MLMASQAQHTLYLFPGQGSDSAIFRKMNFPVSFDLKYMERALDMIIYWQRETHDPNIIHIYKDRDNRLPIKNVKATLIIEGGSHMMALTRGEEIGMLMREQL